MSQHPDDPRHAQRQDGRSAEVRLRAWADGDFPLLERLLGNPAATQFIGGPESPEKLRERHQRYLALDDSSADSVFAIVAGAEESSAGWVGYWESEWESETVWEIGWHVLPEFQGRGVATAAARLALERARDAGGPTRPPTPCAASSGSRFAARPRSSTRPVTPCTPTTGSWTLGR